MQSCGAVKHCCDARCGMVQVFRATHGKAQVWGKAPSFITAKYTPADGQEKTSLLLTSGMPSHHIHHKNIMCRKQLLALIGIMQL